MRDQYAGDVSDFLKFAFLRALAGEDRILGIAWYYATPMMDMWTASISNGARKRLGLVSMKNFTLD